MQISNNTHYSSDAYLISKKQYDVEHKNELESEKTHTDISTAKLEEKIYAKSINALQPFQQSASASNSANNDNSSTNAAAEKALASYNEVENNGSSQQQFNQIKEMV